MHQNVCNIFIHNLWKFWNFASTLEAIKTRKSTSYLSHFLVVEHLFLTNGSDCAPFLQLTETFLYINSSSYEDIHCHPSGTCKAIIVFVYNEPFLKPMMRTHTKHLLEYLTSLIKWMALVISKHCYMVPHMCIFPQRKVIG